MKRALMMLALIAAGSAPLRAQATAAPTDSMAYARKLAEWFFTSQVDSLWAHSSAAMKEQMQKPGAWTEALAELSGRAGTEEQVIEEKFVKRNGNTQYWRTSKYSTMSEPAMLRFAFSPGFEIIGIGMNPASQAPAIDPIR